MVTCLAVSVAAEANPTPYAAAGLPAMRGSSSPKDKEFLVTIDINPGVFPTAITPGRSELISVAVLSTGDFDATTVDPNSVLFGANGTEATPLNFTKVDVNGDGRLDAIFQFEMEYTGLVCGSASAVLTGKTFAGRDIKGTHAVETKGC